MSDLFDEMRSVGCQIPDKVDFLINNGWESYKHHDNWVKRSWSVYEKNASLLDLNEAFNQCARELLKVKDAVWTLSTALKEDEGFFLAYQSNIAMAFMDEFRREAETRHDFYSWLMNEGGLHTISNDASINFLNMFTNNDNRTDI